MFYYETKKPESSQKAKGLREANKILQDSIEKYIQENMEDINKELLDVPKEEHEKYINAIRRRLQREAIQMFNNELKEEIKQLKEGKQLDNKNMR